MVSVSRRLHQLERRRRTAQPEPGAREASARAELAQRLQVLHDRQAAQGVSVDQASARRVQEALSALVGGSLHEPEPSPAPAGAQTTGAT